MKKIYIDGFYEFVITTCYSEKFIIIARSYSSAKYMAFNHEELGEHTSYKEFIMDASQHYFSSIKKTGLAKVSSLFLADNSLDYCRNYRNMKFLELGMKVIHNNELLYVIGGRDILEFYNPKTHQIFKEHPYSNMEYYNDNNILIARY